MILMHMTHIDRYRVRCQ